MADAVKIKIAKLTRKELASKFKEGETYNITTVLDELTGRKGGAMGAWADGWKVGDTIEGTWKERTYKDKDGFEQKSWNIENPNKKEFKSGSYGPRKPSIIDAYTVAAALAPVLFGVGKTVKLDRIAKLAEELMKRFAASTPAEPKADGKDIDISKEEKPATPAKKVEEDDDFEVKEPAKEEAEESEDDDDEIF